MKELAKKYAICAAHLDAHRKREPVMCCSIVGMLMHTTAIAESIAHFSQLGLVDSNDAKRYS